MYPYLARITEQVLALWGAGRRIVSKTESSIERLKGDFTISMRMSPLRVRVNGVNCIKSHHKSWHTVYVTYAWKILRMSAEALTLSRRRIGSILTICYISRTQQKRAHTSNMVMKAFIKVDHAVRVKIHETHIASCRFSRPLSSFHIKWKVTWRKAVCLKKSSVTATLINSVGTVICENFGRTRELCCNFPGMSTKC